MKEDARMEASGLVEECFGSGLERVAKVIEAVADYDGFLRPERLGKAQYGEIIAEHSNGRVDAAAAIMARLIRTTRLSIFGIPTSARILSFAKTHNNRLQLEYFERKTRAWRSTGLFELSTCDVDRSNRVEHHFSESLESQLRAFLLGRRVLSRSLIHQLIGYSSSYCGMVVSLSASMARGLVVANDHSPIPVAISMAAKARGITRVYLQHAQVTTSFPPLDFEYSILMNRRSKRIYELLEDPLVPAAGEVVVLRREGEPIGLDEALKRASALADHTEVAVGVYPSAIFNEQRVAVLIAGLKSNRGISNIFLKPHPSLDLSALAESLGVDLRAQVPAIAHVAVVGNSSVAHELAIAGNLVFQDFDLDPIERDYYGFVKAGLTRELFMQDLEKPFWLERSSSELVQVALTEHFKESAPTLDESGERQFFQKVSIDIGGGLAPSMTPAAELANCLKMFPRSYLEALRTRGLLDLDAMTAVSLLDNLFNERTLNLNALYPFVDPGNCRSVVDFWLVAKLVQWSGSALSDLELTACRTFISSYEGEAKVKRWMEAKYFDLLMQMNRRELLGNFLSSAEYFTVKSAHLNKKIAFVKMCSSPTGAPPDLVDYYDYSTDKLGDLERLKIEVQCMIRQGEKLLFDDYRDVEARFIRVAPPGVARDYADVVLAVYDRIRGRAELIDVKRNRKQSNALLSLAVKRLQDRQGFSAVRLSDGEGYLFRESSPFFTESDARNRERHWWGAELTDGLRQMVVACGLETVSKADVIGIPSIYRFLRDCSPKSSSLLASIQGRGLASVLHGVLEHVSGSAIFSDDKFNIAVFNQKQNLEVLASHARRIIVVTGARSDVIKEALSYLGDVDVINVPTHNKTSSNSRFYMSEKPLPYSFADIRDQVEEGSAPGTLVLVGAGVAGKPFVNAAKSAGGVGLDLGSALDELVDAGIHSLH